MQRAGAAEGDHGVVARVLAALRRDNLNCPDDVGVGDADRAVGDLFDAHAEASGKRAEGFLCGVGIDLHLAAEEGFAADRVTHKVGVGHGRLGAAALVTGRPRVGPGALGPDTQHAALVDPDQTATAGADGVDIENRRADRQFIDLEFVADLGVAVFDQADVGARSAYIEGDQVFEP